MNRDTSALEPRYKGMRTVVQRWAELWSTGNLDNAEFIFTPEVRDHRAPPLPDIEGIEAEKQFIASVRSAFPDLRVQIEDVVIEANRVAARVVHRGTHKGSFLGLAPTGRSVTYEGTVIFRVADGRIAERWGTVDLFGILWQLEALSTLHAETVSLSM